METRELDKLEQEMLRCIRCGYCFEFCPTFREEGWEAASARGRVTMAYALSHGELEPDEKIAHRFFQCTTCKDCMNRCSAGVDLQAIVQATRADLVRAGFTVETQRAVVKNIREKGNIFGDEDVSYSLMDGQIPVFLGCNYLARANQIKRWFKVMEKAGIRVKTVEEICCGFPMKVAGFYDDFEAYRERFIKAFPFKEAITFCPSCGMFLREEYGIKTTNVITALAEKIEPTKKLEMKVTYHDPCDLGRGSGVYEDPRKLIRRLGVELIEMKYSGKDSRCCGGGGGILTADTSLSQRIAMHRITEAVETGAEMLVTCCATCENTLKQAAAALSKEGKPSIKVRDVSQLVFSALK